MKYLFLLPLIMPLAACDFQFRKPVSHQICEDIAVSRLKHPDSYRNISLTEHRAENGRHQVKLSFRAWNGYKVPVPHRIDCIFRDWRDRETPDLVAIKWNGRNIRSHELDDIRDRLAKE